MKGLATSTRTARVALRSKSHWRQKYGTETSCCEALDHLLKTYATNVSIGEIVADLMRLTQPSLKFLIKYPQALWNKAQRCGRLYDGTIEGYLSESIQLSMRSYWGLK